MVKRRRALAGAAGLALALGLLAIAPTAQAACGDYGEPPCPTQTATPPPTQPPAPSPTPTPSRTPTASPTPTPAPSEVTNPQNATVIGGGIIVVSESVAQEVQVQPRLILQPLGVTQAKGQIVVITRFAAHAVVVQFLKPDVTYLTQIKVKDKWVALGETDSNGIGQLPIPVFRATLLGTFPLRVVEQRTGKQTRFMTLVVKASRPTTATPAPTVTRVTATPTPTVTRQT